jgi:hypothetical protein
MPGKQPFHAGETTLSCREINPFMPGKQQFHAGKAIFDLSQTNI